MSLSNIIDKEPTIATPSANDLANAPEEWQRKFQFHVDTYVAIADVTNRWDAILNNLLKGRSATGLIYADTGYGKTSTGASLWRSAEEKRIVAVPPFIWDSLADMLTATHGWVRYRLKSTMPDLIRDLDQKHQSVVAVGEKVLAQKMSSQKRLSVEQSRDAISLLKAEGRLRDALSPAQLLDYLRFATNTLLKAGYKGLLILPDEFELFKDNLDTAQNFNHLKDFIFGIHSEENLPIGCVVFTYRHTHADIDRRQKHILARFNKPEGSLIDLEQFYGQTDFARHLWDKLADSCRLSSSERLAIDSDVLGALRQFLRHTRARNLISGPRSVVRTFNQAARHYNEHNCPYSLVDFCDDYLSGQISYGSQETEAAQVSTQIMGLPSVNSETRRKLVKLLCVHPAGVPRELYQKYGISDSEADSVVQALLGQHVITKVTGPTLVCYRDDLLGVDELNEILKLLKVAFSPTDREFHRGALRAFNTHVLPTIFRAKQGASLGWKAEPDRLENWDLSLIKELVGTVLAAYPERTLTVDVGTEHVLPPSSASRFRARFILDTTGDESNTCRVNANGLEFRFNMRIPINPQKVPEDIGKLGELFLPQSITPLLLLSILDFFDNASTAAIVERENQKTEVNFLKERILNELVGYFFSPEVKAETVFDSPELSTDFASVPAGKTFVERALQILIPKQFPDYSAIATSAQWKRYLDAYSLAISKAPTLGVKRGIEPLATSNPRVPELFSLSGVNAFRNFYSVLGRELLRVEDNLGNQIDVTSKNVPVAVYFTLHPLEANFVELLQDSRQTVEVDSKPVNAVESRAVYQYARGLGYLDDEIEALISILKVRGIADTRTVAGTEHLYLVEKFINLAELRTKFEGLEADVKLAESKGFQYRCDSLSSARVLMSTLSIENDEVQKDTLRQKLNSAETHLKNSCAEWIRTAQSRLEQKTYELETLHLEVPRDLEPQPNYPLTEFSQILFQSIQSKVRLAYTRLSDDIQELQKEVQETCDSEIQKYQANATRPNAIETANRLRDACSCVDEKIEKLKEKQVAAEEHFGLFGKWRILTSRIATNRQLMEESAKDKNVANLIAKLDDVERKIRQYLADNRLSLTEVLSNHEYFKNLVEELKTEFDQFLGGKEKEFIADKTKLEKQLASVVDPPHIEVRWNPAAIDSCYRETREKAVEKLKLTIGKAQNQIDSLMRDLLGPIEIFAVPGSLRSRAIQLRDNVREYASEIQVIRTDLTSAAVDSKMSGWVEALVILRQKGEKIFQRWQAIRREQAEFESRLSPKAQKLRNTLNPLLDDGTFSSPREILECLTELYRGKLD